MCVCVCVCMIELCKYCVEYKFAARRLEEVCKELLGPLHRSEYNQ